MHSLNLPVVSDQFLIDYFCRNKLLVTSQASNAKIAKSNKSNDFRTAYLPLLPANLAGSGTVCPNSKHCINGCIGHNSGQNSLQSAILSKYYKTLFFRRLPKLFFNQLFQEIENFDKLCYRSGLKACIRLNAYSDVVYERIKPDLFQAFSGVLFYDYTKLKRRFDNPIPSNYFLTHSLVAADNPDLSDFAGLHRQFSAVVSREIYDSIDWKYSELFRERYKMTWINGYSVKLINGDNDDLTFEKSKGILLLREKYKKKPEKDNPLVYRDKAVFGL